MKIVTYKELLLEFVNKDIKIPYYDYLRTLEWRKFRDEIVERDNNKCLNCGTEPKIIEIPLTKIQNITNREDITCAQFVITKKTNGAHLKLKVEGLDFEPTIKLLVPTGFVSKIWLEVHHTYYIKNHLPWEYESVDLKTLCRSCHQKEHDDINLIQFTDITKTESSFVETCSKCNGTGHIPQYDYFRDGICFNCNGAGYL